MMKKFTLLLALAALFATVSCDDDNNRENPLISYGDDVAGTYSGYSVVTIGGADFETCTDQQLTLTSNADGTVNLRFKDETWVWGEYALDDLTVTKSGSTYSIAAEGEVIISTMSGEGTAGPYDYEMNAGIVSSTDAQFVFKLTIGSVMPETVITFKTGNPPVEPVTPLEPIAGTYAGYSVATVGGNPYDTYTDQQLTLSANADGTVNLSFKDASWPWGEYALDNLAVTESDGKYTISGEGDDLFIQSMNGGGTAGPYGYQMNASIVSVTDAEFVFKLSIGAMMPETVITFKTGNPPVDPTTPLESIAGTYTGSSSAVFMYSTFPVVTEDETVTITENTDGRVDIVFESSMWGTFAVESVEAVEKEGVFTFSADGASEMEGHETVNTYDFTLNGTVSSAGAVLIYNVADLMGGTEITFTAQ